MVRTFGSKGPAEPVVENPVPLEFSIAGDDHVYTAMPPTGGQMMVMSKAMESGQGAAGTIQFLMGILTDDDFDLLRGRLLSREDTLSLEDLSDLFSWLMEEWGRTPTAGRSGSSESPGTAGRGSTARRRSTART